MLKDELNSLYGPTMTIPNLAELFHVSKGSIYNKISKDIFEITTIKLGGRVVAMTNDVVDFIDNEKLRSNHS